MIPVPLSGYDWSTLQCGFDLLVREDQPEAWAGPKCDLREGNKCECHHFGGDWWWKESDKPKVGTPCWEVPTMLCHVFFKTPF